MRAYVPQSFEGSLTYLRAAESENGDSTWDGLALGGVEVHDVPGNHLSMHAPPNAGVLADLQRRGGLAAALAPASSKSPG